MLEAVTMHEYVPSSSRRLMFIMTRLYIPVAGLIITDKRSLLSMLRFLTPSIEYIRKEGGPFQVVLVEFTGNKTGQTSVRLSPSRPYIVSRQWICAIIHKNQSVIFYYMYSKYHFFSICLYQTYLFYYQIIAFMRIHR